MNINEKLATALMGYVRKGNLYHSPDIDYLLYVEDRDSIGVGSEQVTVWDPEHDLKQAMECADKCDKIYISVSKTPLGWAVYGGREFIVVKELYQIPMAICSHIVTLGL